MCHLLLLLPFIALPIFWLAPLSVAGPTYAAVVVVSGGVYYLAMRAMRQPVVTGVESLLNETGEVIDQEDRCFHVRVEGEIWKAQADGPLAVGDKVEIVSVDGLTLKVRRVA